jgi:hypothetical protein
MYRPDTVVHTAHIGRNSLHCTRRVFPRNVLFFRLSRAAKFRLGRQAPSGIATDEARRPQGLNAPRGSRAFDHAKADTKEAATRSGCIRTKIDEPDCSLPEVLHLWSRSKPAAVENLQFTRH